MRDDLTPILVNLPSERDVRIYPLFDMHVGSQQYDEKKFRAWREKILSEPDSYVIVGGDIMDNGVKSSVTNVYEQAMRPSEQKHYLMEELKPIRDRILCGTCGNHEQRSVREDDDDPVYDVFCKLDLEEQYRPNICFMFIRFGDKDRHARPSDKRPTYSVAVTHGAGGGAYVGSGLNRLERFGAVIDGLDLIVQGHTHKPSSFPVGKIRMDPQNNRVAHAQFVGVVADSFLNWGGYAARKMLTPTGHARQEIILSAIGKDIRVLQ